MNSELDSGTPARSAAIPAISPVEQLTWLLRRELWENRSVWVAPLVAVAAMLIGHFFVTIGHALSMDDLIERQAALEALPHVSGLLLMGVAFLVALIYCLEALHGERRDRSILFWKSLPVSDRMTVLSKLVVPMLIVPAVCFAAAFVGQWLMLVMNSVALSMSGLDSGTLWQSANFVENMLALLFHLVGIHGLWYAPIYAWLLLASVWAKRAPMLWAILPPMLLGSVEMFVFRSSHLFDLISHRFSGGAQGELYMAEESAAHPIAHLAPIEFLFSPGLLLGFAAAAGFVLLAARIRGEREPS